MNTLIQIRRILQLHELIKSQKTGSCAELARILKVSHRTVGTYLEELRDMGAVIKFDSVDSTYYYENDFNFEFKLDVYVSASAEEK